MEQKVKSYKNALVVVSYFTTFDQLLFAYRMTASAEHLSFLLQITAVPIEFKNLGYESY